VPIKPVAPVTTNLIDSTLRFLHLNGL